MLGKSTFEEIISYLKTLSPSGVELEFISLASIIPGKEPNEMVSYLYFLIFLDCIHALNFPDIG